MALHKTTIVIWTDYNPTEMEVDIEDLAREATSGPAYCSKMVTEYVHEPEEDDDWDGTEFFG